MLKRSLFALLVVLCLTSAAAARNTPIFEPEVSFEIDFETAMAGEYLLQMHNGEGDGPPFVAGRMVLPWGRTGDGHGLVLALRNDARHAPRAFRVIFYAPNGEPVAASEARPLPPRGSVAFNVEALMDVGSWSAGSLEVIYTGPGPGRLFGTARQGFPSPEPATETQPLVQAAFGIAEAP